jgi:hypothetical protein
MTLFSLSCITSDTFNLASWQGEKLQNQAMKNISIGDHIFLVYISFILLASAFIKNILLYKNK